MRKNKRVMVQKPEPEDLRMKTAITAEEVKGLAEIREQMKGWKNG